MKDKLKQFLNSLTWDEAKEFWRFLRSKQWSQWIEARVRGEKID